MMKRNILFAVICAFLVLCTGINAFADEMQPSPYLNSISFKNGTSDQMFSPEVTDYTMTLADNKTTPTLESYSMSGDANLFVTYAYDETNHQTGVIATLQYESGSTIYNFKYSNPAQYEANNECHLKDIFCTYGDVVPDMTDDKTEYKLYIPSDLTSLQITPVTKDVNAYCAPVELTLLKTQEPKLTLKSTASDGTEIEYTIKVCRADKTTDQVQAEMAQPGYVTFVDKTPFYEQPLFRATSLAALGGIAVVAIIIIFAKRMTVSVYDKDEKPFYA